jgi:hypothetical protein
MKRFAICIFLLILAFAANVSAQPKTKRNTKAASTTSQKSAFYISVARCNYGQYSKKKWQQTADKLKRGGIPAFFASTESIPDSTREKWLLIKINRRYPSAEIDALVLGPFSSKQVARDAVNKFPNLISGEGEPLRENYDAEWSMGCFIMLGARTK